MKYILLITSLLPGISFGDEFFNCDDLIGKWEDSRFEYSLGSQRYSVSEHKTDGTFIVSFEYKNGVDVTTTHERGKWSCDGKFIYIHTTSVENSPASYHDTYKILNLDASYQRVQVVDQNCKNIIGDCIEDKAFEYTKL